MTYCLTCGKMIEEYDSGYYARNMLCIPCYETKRIDSGKVQCLRCMRSLFPSEMKSLEGHGYCPDCHRRLALEIESRRCNICRRVLGDWENRLKTPDNKVVCKKCHDEKMGKLGTKQCALCGRNAKIKMIVNDKFFCMDCYPKIEKKKNIADKLVGMAELIKGTRP